MGARAITLALIALVAGIVGYAACAVAGSDPVLDE